MAGRISNTAPKNNRPAPAETSDWRGRRGRPARRARGDDGLRRGEDMRSMGIRMLYGRDGNGADGLSKPPIIAHARAPCGSVGEQSTCRPRPACRSWQSVGFDIRCPHPQGHKEPWVTSSTRHGAGACQSARLACDESTRRQRQPAAHCKPARRVHRRRRLRVKPASSSPVSASAAGHSVGTAWGGAVTLLKV